MPRTSAFLERLGPSGTWSGEGASACTKCVAGTWSDAVGADSVDTCTNCATGTWSGEGASACTKCAAGSYASNGGANACTNCAAGQYSTEGSSSCLNCGGNSFSASGDATCTGCPEGTSTNGLPGQDSCDYVIPGYHWTGGSGGGGGSSGQMCSGDSIQPLTALATDVPNCTPCASLGTNLVADPTHTQCISDGTVTTVTCHGPKEIVVGTSCMACTGDLVPDDAKTSCVCPTNEVLNQATSAVDDCVCPSPAFVMKANKCTLARVH